MSVSTTVFGARDFNDVQGLAEQHSYEIVLWVFAPSSPDICRAHIEDRKSTSGHGLPNLAADLYESALSAASEFSFRSNYTFLIEISGKCALVAWFESFNTMEVFAEAPE